MKSEWRIFLGGAWVVLSLSCGDVAQSVVASGAGGGPHDSSPTPSTGSGGNNASPALPEAGGGLGGAGAEGAGYPCTLCSIYKKCEGSNLHQQLNAHDDCDDVMVSCEHGCVGTGGGWAGCAIECGGEVCPAPPMMFPLERVQCCTAQGRCGISGLYSNELACIPVEPPAPVDPSCPPAFPGPNPGCCAADGTCGVLDPVPGAGCVSALDLGADAASACDASTDASTDAGTDSGDAEGASD